MQPEIRIGAGRTILIAATLAVLLLWMDGWSHSMPVMFATAVAALFVFLSFRPTEAARELTHAERIELEREAALVWTQRNADYRDE